MIRSSVTSLAAMTVFLCGCLYKELGREPLPNRVDSGEVRLAGVGLAGSVTIEASGGFRFELAMQGRCEQPTTTYSQTKVSKRKNDSLVIVNSILSLYGAIGGLAGGGVLTGKGYTEIGVPLLLFGLGNVANVGRALGAKRERTDIKKKQLSTSVAPASCTPDLAQRALDRTPRELMLTSPWRTTSRARVTGRVAVFSVDWAASAIDPLAADAAARAVEPWRITATDGSGEITWTPNDAGADAILVAIGKAVGTELTAAVGEAPPLLEIEALDTRGAMPAGVAVRTALTITNKGRGSAYRVVATTKSSDPALHGLRYSFGRIGPGESITKYLEVTIPRDHEDGKALVVVNVTEANGNVPDRFSHEVAIVHSGRPRLRVACDVTQGPNKVNQTATVDAGRQLRLRCTVQNEGDGPAIAAQVDAALGASGTKSSTTGDIAAGGKGTFDVLLVVPSDARTGQSWGLNVEAHETNFGARAAWSLPVEIGLMQICQPPIKRDAYERKLAEVRGLGLDAATLKAYEEQLVACLGD